MVDRISGSFISLQTGNLTPVAQVTPGPGSCRLWVLAVSRRLCPPSGMSPLPQLATRMRTSPDLKRATTGLMHSAKKALFHDLVGESYQLVRHGKAERLCGFGI